MVRLPKNYRLHPFKRFGFADVRSKPVSTYTKQEKYAERHEMYWTANKDKQCRLQSDLRLLQYFDNEEKNTTVPHKYC